MIHESIEEDLISVYSKDQVLEEIFKGTSMNFNILDNSSDPSSPTSDSNFTESNPSENDSKKEPFVHAKIVVADD